MHLWPGKESQIVDKKSDFINKFLMAWVFIINILENFTNDTLYNVKNDVLEEINTPQISQFHLFT